MNVLNNEIIKEELRKRFTTEKEFNKELIYLQRIFDLFIPENVELNPAVESGQALSVELNLSDMYSFTPDKDKVKTRVNLSAQGVSFGFDGYGDEVGDGLNGKPLLVEYADSKVRSVIWPNINNEDQLEIIALGEEAKTFSRVA